MIYIIDDNKYDQMSVNYKIDYVGYLQSLPKHVIWLQTLAKTDIDLIMCDADCVLIHDSVDEKDDKEKLIMLARRSNIPFCIFSNGFTSTVFEGESIREIKKDRFYNNLNTLINAYQTNQKIDLKLLAFGKNYEVEKASIVQDRLINGTLFAYKKEFIYEVAFPSGSEAYKDLIELFNLSNPIIDFSEFEEKYNSPQVTAMVMHSAIIEMVKSIKKRNEQQTSCD